MVTRGAVQWRDFRADLEAKRGEEMQRYRVGLDMEILV